MTTKSFTGIFPKKEYRQTDININQQTVTTSFPTTKLNCWNNDLDRMATYYYDWIISSEDNPMAEIH